MLEISNVVQSLDTYNAYPINLVRHLHSKLDSIDFRFCEEPWV